MEQGDVATSDTGSYVNSPLCAGYPLVAAAVGFDREGGACCNCRHCGRLLIPVKVR
jgi:hypothetical protein